jgi:uncharacterized protein GlcG (DUF336 family)
MKIWLKTALCVSLSLALFGAELADKKALTLEVAKQIADAAEKSAASRKLTMVITILDEGGNLIYLAKMDDTQIGSIAVAQAKAKSAISFKRPTKVFEEGVAGGRNALLSLPGAMPIEGGIPITVNGKIIGAIGVSGGTSAEDGQVAQAGLDALPKILGK